MDGTYVYDEKESFDGRKIRVLGATYETGSPDCPSDWRDKLPTREEKLNYIKSAMRYWYSKEWFGSEKRKQEA